jgi:hypothetical protein
MKIMGKKKNDKLDYISSLPMEDLETQERIISLGKLLSEELEQGKHPDTLSRWMAHYIAQLIANTENSTGIKKKALEKECFNTILKLWEYKSSFPDGKKPFERFEEIFKTLEKLSPDNQNNFFYENQQENETDDDLIKKSMRAIRVIDKAVRIWMEYILRDAVDLASDEKTKKWLNMAIPTRKRDEVNIYFKIFEQDDNDDLKSTIKGKIKNLESRIEQLEGFKNYNEMILTSFTNQITSLKSVINNKKPSKKSHG